MQLNEKQEITPTGLSLARVSSTLTQVDDICKGLLRSPCAELEPIAALAHWKQVLTHWPTIFPGPVGKKVEEVEEIVLRPWEAIVAAPVIGTIEVGWNVSCGGHLKTKSL